MNRFLARVSNSLNPLICHSRKRSNDPFGDFTNLEKRVDTGEKGQFRKLSRDWIAERGDNLDIAWLKDDREGDNSDLPEPAVLAQEAMVELEAAMSYQFKLSTGQKG